jgi:hypothetical protein
MISPPGYHRVTRFVTASIRTIFIVMARYFFHKVQWAKRLNIDSNGQ